MAEIGKRTGVATPFGLKVHGFLAWWIWRTYYLGNLPTIVRGKARVKIHEDVDHNIPIANKFIMKSIGSLDHPIAKWLLTQIQKGQEVILEITPSYYSTWRSAVPMK